MNGNSAGANTHQSYRKEYTYPNNLRIAKLGVHVLLKKHVLVFKIN